MIGALGTGAVAALAGCTGSAATPPREREERTLVDATLRVDPGTHESAAFSLDDERWLTVGATLSDRSVDVKNDGPAVDVYVLTPDAAAAYRAGESVDYVAGVSMPDVVSGQVSSTVPPGAYELLIDNTKRGSGEPDGSGAPAVVRVEVTAGGGRDGSPVGADPYGG